jgi:hypothetical protein
MSVDISPDDGALAAAVLAGQGPLTKSQLGERLAEAGLAVSGQAIVHLAVLAAGQGRTSPPGRACPRGRSIARGRPLERRWPKMWPARCRPFG